MERLEGYVLDRDKFNSKKYWSLVDRINNNGCWLWLGDKNVEGYGRMMVGSVYEATHRIAYLIRYKFIPKGTSILHSCDNPSCVNPKHLRIGTHKDNMNDVYMRGRMGGNLYNISDKLILMVYELQDIGLTKKEIREKLGLTKSLVDNIFNRSKIGQINRKDRIKVNIE